MFELLSFKRFKSLASQNRRIAVYKEIAGDRLTPINALMALQQSQRNITLLESSPKEKELGRYSHLCFEPIATIKAFGQRVLVDYRGETLELNQDPFTVLREYKAKLKAYLDHPLSGFIGGLVGFVSYDGVRLIEDIADKNLNKDNIPDILLRSYAHNITFDHQTGKVIISTMAEVTADVENNYRVAMDKIDSIIKLLHNDDHHHIEEVAGKIKSKPEINVDTDDQAFCDMVQQAKQHIVEGDVFQVVLSRNYSVKVSAKPFDIYRALRFSNPSPYMFYIEADDYVIAGASPEKLVSIRDGIVESCPLAGTRPRGKLEDAALAAELLADKKEVAEHMMLVDLSRNDVGRVAIPGTVNVTKLKEIEKYSRVIHISSTVQGKLKKEFDVFDVIKAAFPAGTLSGAPKIRAMNIIDSLENNRRGVYGGVICAIDSNDNLESCIAIRTTIIKDGVASVRAGAGVVFDSEPQKEADETYHKARAIVEGILLAEGGQL